MLLKCCTQHVSKFGKLSSGHRTRTNQFSFQSQRRAMPKNVQITIQLHSFLMLIRLCSKFFKLDYSVQSLSHVWLFATPWTAARQASLSITNSQSLLRLMSLSQWCRPTISSSAIPFSSCLQSFPASGCFPMSLFFSSRGQSIGVSASTSVLPMNTQDWFPLGWTGLISLQSKWLSKVFSNTTVQKHQFCGTQLSLLFNSHIHTWLLEKP